MHLSDLIDGYFAQPDIYLHDNDGRQVSTLEINENYSRLLHFIAEKGQRPVGVSLNFGYRYLLAILACMRMGVPYVPLRTSWPKARKQEIIDLVGIKTVIDETFYESMMSQEVSPGTAPPPLQSASKSPAYIITTSGTTGQPKAVVISRGAIENFYNWLEGYFDRIDCNDRMLMITDFTFDISHIDIGLLLYKKFHLHFSKFNRNINFFSLAAEIEEYNVTVVNTVPNNFTLLLQDAIVKRANFSSLTHLVLGGARFSSGTYAAVFGKLQGLRVFNMYGPTEATVYSHVAMLTGDMEIDMIDNNVTIGTPISNMGACLIHSNGDIIDTAEENGQLCLSGAQLMTCYLNNEEQTNKVIVTLNGMQYYKTGDLSYRDTDGRYFVVGRLDDTVKRRGFRTNLLDIDSYIQRLEQVQDSKTIALPSELYENILVTFVVPINSVTEIQILKELEEVLPSHQIPDEVRLLASFPLNNAGKVSVQALADLCDNQ